LIEQQTGLPQTIDGILGMCLGMPIAGIDYQPGPLYVDGLKNSSIIDERTFSFFMADNPTQSFIDFGEPRDAAMRNPDDLIYVPLEQHFFWLGIWTGVRYGEDPDNAWGYSDVPAIYDTGTSLLYVASSQNDGFFHYLTKDRVAEYYAGVYLTNCDPYPWPTVYFLTANSTWMAVEPSTYLLNADTTSSVENALCVIGMVPNSGDYWLVGDVFLRGFYSVHRMDDMTIGFVPHAGSTKPRLDDYGSFPNKLLASPINWGGLGRNIMVFMLFYGGWFAGLYYGLDPTNSSFQNNKKIFKKKVQKPAAKKVVKEESSSTEADLANVLAALQEHLANA